MNRPPDRKDQDDLTVIWDWHRGLLRRATLALTLFALVGSLAMLIGVQPISHHYDQLRLVALADLHRAELDDFREVARIERALHSGAAGGAAVEVLQPLRAHLGHLDPTLVARIDPTVRTCLKAWDTGLSALQTSVRHNAAAPPAGAEPGAGGRTPRGDDEVLLKDLVQVRDGFSAVPRIVTFATTACAGPEAGTLGDFCPYFTSIRDGGLVRYEQVADNYTAPPRQSGPERRLGLSLRTDDPCLKTPNDLRSYPKVAELADGAALVRTLGDFRDLGARIAGQSAALALQNGGVIAGAPGGIFTISLSQRSSYVAFTALAGLALIYGHYHLRRLGDLLTWIPKDAAHAAYRLWPHFMPVFMSPVASVQFGRPAQGGRVAGWTHRLFKLLDALPPLAFLLQVAAAVVLAGWTLRNPSAGLGPTLLGVGALLALQLLVLADYLRERREIAAWIAERNAQAPAAPVPTTPARGAPHAT